MGRDFGYSICTDSCECNYKNKSCICDKKCQELPDQENKYCKTCECKKEKPDDDVLYLRNNTEIWKRLDVYEPPKHFLYKDIENIVSLYLDKKSKMDIMLLLVGDQSYKDREYDLTELMKALVALMMYMKEYNAKCIWLWNS
jgi:hypothetical protein